MAAGDNTLLNPGSGGDTIRTLDRTGTGVPKTEVVQLDQGGADPNAESLVSVAAPLHVTLDQDTRTAMLLQLTAQAILVGQANAQNGFYPFELPPFLGV